MTSFATVSETDLLDLELVHRGKVRDVYAVDEEHLLLVATDRISAFDCILPTPIENKGRVLTQLSSFWFGRLDSITGHHLVSAELSEMPHLVSKYQELNGRAMLTRRTEVFPVECVVRGYLEGSGWKDYQQTGTISGRQLPNGLAQCDKLPEPLFTPATKAASGHDENISDDEFVNILGSETANILKQRSLDIYNEASNYALSKGIIIADTKFEFGLTADGEIILIDEVLTPDSSRFWATESYSPGKAQASFDKQFVREYLETLDWDKTPPAPPLPNEIAEATTARYMQAYKLLTGHDLPD